MREACSRRISRASSMACSSAIFTPSGNLSIASCERRRLDLEHQRQHAGGRQQLRLAGEQHRARRIGRAVGRDRLQAADGAGAPIGEDLFLVEAGRVELDLGKIGLRCHAVGSYRLWVIRAAVEALQGFDEGPVRFEHVFVRQALRAHPLQLLAVEPAGLARIVARRSTWIARRCDPRSRAAASATGVPRPPSMPSSSRSSRPSACGFALARLDLAAGKFPAAGHVLARRALAR